MASQRIKLEVILSTLTALAAVAYSLGWLKTLYYFQAFGIGLPSLQLSVQDYLFESWFVLENVFFFVLFSWCAVKTARWWVIAIALIYSFLPIAAHYAFLASGHAPAEFLIKYRHTILKFLPLAVLLVVWIFDRSSFQKLKDLSWPYGDAAFVLFVTVVLAWSVSTAKHFGSYDANSVQRSPDRYLPHAKVHFASNVSEKPLTAEASELYVIYETPARYFLWNHTDFKFGESDTKLHLIVIEKERIEWVETWKSFQVQQASLFL
jgi:hypothetical protein